MFKVVRDVKVSCVTSFVCILLDQSPKLSTILIDIFHIWTSMDLVIVYCMLSL